MTCKDCFYYDVCNAHMNINGIAMRLCAFFKNKADFVEVVRCKDCEYYKATGRLGEFDEPMGVCKKDVNFWDDEPREVLSVDFCSDGKKVQK